MTRRDVTAAARKLFAEHGYEQTTVAMIAREARVSPATVYAQCGGKEGLLSTLMDMWTTSPTVGRIISDAAEGLTGRDKLRILADGYVAHAAEAGDIMRIVERAAASSTPAEEFMEIADSRHTEALEIITKGIADVGELADGLSVTDAAKIVYFHFRNPQLVLASETFGWGIDRAQRWLLERVEAAILKP
ncbi:TetR/AcrR family transcriptional regulator [Herbiconiux sp. VKM Ac-2851]|uniref:TetR/AcrR family transcriptional regulator n=1 Tax=Herbiconiux sp. VKM Ac-2851 TaxID=2739025 RepID=UPI00156690EC|nr:TetR/AcrR family transcriptional regulator [Herbiconiux sp. VKM Ac-2851]NQX37156.1 TetR/AcrR family transcriptional regulator [Herbiconiux sp. VKM Ac-2851]